VSDDKKFDPMRFVMFCKGAYRWKPKGGRASAMRAAGCAYTSAQRKSRRWRLPGIKSLVESLVGEGSVARKCQSNRHYLGVNPGRTHRLAVTYRRTPLGRPQAEFSARSRDVNSSVRKDQAQE
jgi:hypothetical protein